MLFLLLACSAHGFAGEVVVAAASDLSFAIREIAADFQKRTGHTVKLSLGSSGNFHAQIVNGAPFDVFLSADVNYVRELERAGLTETGTSYVYAAGRIVLWVPNGSPIDVAALGMKALQHPQARRIAIANPDHAPYGKAAVSAMQKAGVYDAAKSRLVLGESISQAAQFVESRAADIGCIALSLAVSDPMKTQGRYWEIPADMYPRIDQGGVILRRARTAGHSDAARQFLDTLRTPAGRAILQRYGFNL